MIRSKTTRTRLFVTCFLMLMTREDPEAQRNTNSRGTIYPAPEFSSHLFLLFYHSDRVSQRVPRPWLRIYPLHIDVPTAPCVAFGAATHCLQGTHLFGCFDARCLSTTMVSSKVLIWSGRVLAAIFILAGASKISYPVQVNPSFLDGALKVGCPLSKRIQLLNSYRLLSTSSLLSPGRCQVELDDAICHCSTPPPPLPPSPRPTFFDSSLFWFIH